MKDKREKPNNLMERRNFIVEELRVVRAKDDSDEPAKIMGHAAVFNTLSQDLGWFREKIDPGAFAESIKEDDIRALFNHDPNFVLGRNTANTLKLSEDDTGLAVEIAPPDTQVARDLLVSIERGDVSQMSFGFRTIDQAWEIVDEEDIRTLKKAKLFDVSPVTFPAYTETDVAVRSLETWKQEHPEEKPYRRELAKRRMQLQELN